MKIIGTTFEKLPRERLVIGFEGENLRATVRIDCASVFAEYPNATPSLIVKPLFADAYPVVVDRNGTDVDWLITSEILSFSGDGEIQLVFYKDEVICKSAVSKIRVCRSLQVTGDMPDPVAQWIDDANRKLAEVDAQIVELEGMVDTATDAATRAEQSASTASAKAEQAAESAATATAKATEATNAAGTATAKAAEAEQSALTASSKASDAAESERISTLKATEANQSAQTASTKASEAAESQRISEEKAQSAQTAESNAQDAKDIALRAKQDALAAQTAAEAARTAAETSATQAGTSEQNAGTAAQTATQKAAEAQQSATDAETFAGTATTKAEEAAESAQAASDAKTAVEQTAEQLADSLEQIAQNTQDIAELDERKANVDGYYTDMTVGNAEQLNSSKYVENSEPYTLRTSGGSSDIGNREYLDAVVGGTVAWNQMVRDEASENSTDFAPIVTVTDAVEDAAGVKVKIEPVQDLHGYDHPWPAGGGVNKLFTVANPGSKTMNGMTVQANDDGTFSLNGTTSGGSFDNTYTLNQAEYVVQDGDYLHIHNTVANASSMILLQFTDNTQVSGYFSAVNYSRSLAEAVGKTVKGIRIYISVGVTLNGTISPEITNSATSSRFSPYSNICPITGWDQAKVTRTGVNVWDEEWEQGNYDGNTGVKSVSDKKIRNKNLIPVLPNTQYYAVMPTPPTKLNAYWYDAERTFISSNTGSGISGTFTTPDKCYFMAFSTFGTAYNTYNHDISINFPSTDHDYHAYQGNTYDITLPTEAGTVYGGELTVNEDGSGSLVVDRASVDLGTLTWKYFNIAGHYRFVAYPQSIKSFDSNTLANILCSGYAVDTANDVFNNTRDKRISSGGGALLVYDSDYSSADDFKTAMSGVQLVYPLATPITYTLTASQIRTLLGTNNVWADTGDLALTYTGTDEHLTLESGKKYLSRISGTDSMLLGSGQEITAAKGTDNVFDLTQMLGTAVADYVYGQGAAFFRKWFGGSHYSYNAGELLSVEGLQSHDMVGFNQWDEEWEVGGLTSTGNKNHSLTNRIVSKNYIPVLPNTSYYFKIDDGAKFNRLMAFYDANKAFITAQYGNGLFITPQNAYYALFSSTNDTYGNVYRNDICISLAHNNSRNGEYAPYEKHSYPLDSSVILRGIPKVGANGVYWDGDRYLPDGTVERRYGVVDLGTLDWNKYNTTFYANVNGLKPTGSSAIIGNIVCTRYTNVMLYLVTGAQKIDKSIAANDGQGRVNAYDSLYADSTAAEFKAAVSGVYLVYELATPTTETAQPYHSTQWVSDWGTEEFVSTGIVPVGHETRYPANLRDKLQHLPDAASGNGSYLITQTDGQMVLTPFPAPPSTAGNYVLKATVVNGVATYTWEVAT